MVRFWGDTSDGVGFCGVCIFFLTVVLNLFDRLGGGMECVLARSPYEVSMVKPSEFCAGVCSEGGVSSVGIIPDVFVHMTHWCVCGAMSIWVGAVGADEVLFVVVGVGVIFQHWHQIVLLIVVRPLHGVLERFGSLLL